MAEPGVTESQPQPKEEKIKDPKLREAIELATRYREEEIREDGGWENERLIPLAEQLETYASTIIGAASKDEILMCSDKLLPDVGFGTPEDNQAWTELRNTPEDKLKEKAFEYLNRLSKSYKDIAGQAHTSRESDMAYKDTGKFLTRIAIGIKSRLDKPPTLSERFKGAVNRLAPRPKPQIPTK
jgi:hypothetical protein